MNKHKVHSSTATNAGRALCKPLASLGLLFAITGTAQADLIFQALNKNQLPSNVEIERQTAAFGTVKGTYNPFAFRWVNNNNEMRFEVNNQSGQLAGNGKYRSEFVVKAWYFPTPLRTNPSRWVGIRFRWDEGATLVNNQGKIVDQKFLLWQIHGEPDWKSRTGKDRAYTESDRQSGSNSRAEKSRNPILSVNITPDGTSDGRARLIVNWASDRAALTVDNPNQNSNTFKRGSAVLLNSSGLKKGRWYNLALNFKMSYEGKAFCKAWVNGTKVVDRRNINIGYNDVNNPYMKWGIYSFSTRPSSKIVVRHSAIRVGNNNSSRSEVAP